MAHQFAALAFTDSVRQLQTAAGSRGAYAAMDHGADYNHQLSDVETTFLNARDSFYMASVSETQWPYLQHRGGPAGFIKVLDSRHIGFADYRGNRQYISRGNFLNNNRVALFFMDYPGRRRLKLLGHIHEINADHELVSQLLDASYSARVERGFIIRVDAFDWNCPQHITPRYTQSELGNATSLSQDKQAPLGHQPLTPVFGDGELNLVISGIRQLTPRVRAYELRQANGELLPAVSPGAHLSLPVELSPGENSLRQYSITSDPQQRDYYEIAVQREEQGAGGSQAIHRDYQLGTSLHCANPANHFSAPLVQQPALLIAGGIGITAIKSISRALQTRGTPQQLHYAGRSLADMPYVNALRQQLGSALYCYPSDQHRRLDIASLIGGTAPHSQIFVCGPASLIAAVYDAADNAGIDRQWIHVERFAATQRAGDRPFQLQLARSQRTLEVTAEQSILDALLSAGVDAPHSCRTGICRSCAVRVISGEPDHRDTALSDQERDSQQLICPCVSRANSHSLTLDL